ncbi:MAG: cation-translocating P-type ATPase [Candidatus Pacearchaeota archaeon]|nr:cation-translocating P-type ATPase [Candidatus Pacearchaeota archaeon]
MEWHSARKEEIVRELNSSVNGLSEYDSRLRLKKYGENVISEIYRLNAFKILVKQFNSFLIYVLLIATVVSLLIQHYIDASVIFAIVLLNAGLGFFQQYKAEKAIIQLRQLFIPQTKVYRDSKLRIISSKEIVPGDILIFEEGDKITADCRILSSQNLEINEAILTGESLAVEKQDLIIKQDGLISERLNMLFAGTTIIRGNVKAIAVSTGMQTEFGRIALKLQEIQLPETPMQRRLDRFAKQVTFIVLILAAITFFLGLAAGRDKIEMFLTSIALLVSAIPEGLPAIITVSLALATKKMLKDNILIRRLPAAETLGSVTVICSDKTGTMTEEKMFVTDAYCNNKFFRNTKQGVLFGNKVVNLAKEKELFSLVKTSILASNARFEETQDNKFQIIGDPTEASFISFALELGVDKKILTEIEPRIKEISFSSERKMMSILRKSIRRDMLYSKGSPSSIIEKCSFELRGEIKKLDDKRKTELFRIAEDLEKKGLRVLAFAFKTTTSDKNLESGLIFLGFLGLLDPPRQEIKQAIQECKNAGIKVKMITGDSLLTARTIASKIGIDGRILGGRELDEMSDEDLLEQIDEIAVFARTEPQQKLRIVEILKLKGEEVAITGDGINDILALKKADIGIAMGKRGSDIARDVSDMVLLDDNFYSIVKGVEQGRIVYDNSKKATKFLLASNIGELLIIAFSIILGMPLPLIPLQILWINLVSDSLPAFALTREQGEETMKSKPRKEDSILSGIFSSIVVTGIVSLICSAIIFIYGTRNLPLETTRTMVMFALIGFEMFFVFSCRSEKPISRLPRNNYIWYAVLAIIILQLILIFTPLASVFRVVSLSLTQWLLVIAASLPGFVVFEIFKIIKYRREK